MTAKIVAASATMIAMLTTASGVAFADNIKYLVRNTSGPTTITVAKAVNIPLNNAGATRVTFNNPKAGLVSVTYSAECGVATTHAIGAFVSIDIMIDGSIVDPTNDDDAFCSASNTLANAVGAMHSVTVAKSLAAGGHTLNIVGSTPFIGTTGILDDTALLIAR